MSQSPRPSLVPVGVGADGEPFLDLVGHLGCSLPSCVQFWSKTPRSGVRQLEEEVLGVFSSGLAPDRAE